MNAKQAEQLTGISRRNLRFYEQQGLIHPNRNSENDYREYSEQDIETLKLIRALRMLDAPLEDISSCLRREMTITELSVKQEQRLKQRQKEVELSIQFCQKLQNAAQIDAQYIDRILVQMDQPDVKKKLFDDWQQDYQKVARAESLKAFSFTPDDSIATPEDFTNALCKYGDENHLNLVVTKEGLEPEFEIDGIVYTAQRIFRRMGPVPVMIVHCSAIHPNELEADVPSKRRTFMKFVHNAWLPLLFLMIWLPRVMQADAAHRWEVLLMGGVLGLVIASTYWVFRNHKN